MTVPDGVHEVSTVRQSDEYPDTDTVILAGKNLPWFRTDHGELSEGDRVRVEDGRYAGRASEAEV